MKLIGTTAAALFLATLTAAPPAGAAVLYDGTLGTTPQAQGNLSYFALAGTATETGAATGTTTLNTTAGGSNAEYAGFSNYLVTGTPVSATFPPLNPAAGFDLSFTAKVDAEAHATNDRAGFSVILLGSDHVGVELGFWTTQVFAQSSTFTHAEQTPAPFDPTAFHNYDLRIAGTGYTLSADGTPVLAGTTRDYSATGIPYTLPSYLFLGDDTGSARGTAEISRIAIAVPEPAAVGTAALGLLLATRRRRR